MFLKGARRGADPGREANRDDAGEDVPVEGDKTERNDTVYSVIEVGNILPLSALCSCMTRGDSTRALLRAR